MSSVNSDNSLEFGDMFADPAGFERPPTPPDTIQYHTLPSGRIVTVHVVGFSATEADNLWNGARVVSDFFDGEPALVKGKNVLEIGAGAGLPSLTAGLLGARRVVLTDYPDLEMVQVMQKNVDVCDAETPEGQLPLEADGETRMSGVGDRVKVRGYIWGYDTAPLHELLYRDGEGGRNPTTNERRLREGEGEGRGEFDVVIMADTLWRHSEHGNQITTLKRTLAKKKGSRAYVFFTSYKPWRRAGDLKFFDLAREAGFEAEHVADHKMEKPMFEGDPGDLDIQKTVSQFELRWPEAECVA